jgi:hypothetical protein
MSLGSSVCMTATSEWTRVDERDGAEDITVLFLWPGLCKADEISWFGLYLHLTRLRRGGISS